MRVIIAHGHIFKNAGTTFDWSLERNFASGFLDHRDDQAMLELGAQHLLALAEERSDLQAVSSHFLCRPLPQTEDIRFEPVCFLRHPLERIDSAYAFEKQQDADTPGTRAAKSMDFRAYVDWHMRAEVARTIRDYQTRNIAGRHETEGQCEVNFRTLKEAMDNLWQVRCVGVVDRYDESMVAFEHVLKDFFPTIDLAYIRQNTGTGESTRLSLSERVDTVVRNLGDLWHQVLANNSFDLALYRFANQKLDEAILAIPDFEARLTDFHQRCHDLCEGPRKAHRIRRFLHQLSRGLS